MQGRPGRTFLFLQGLASPFFRRLGRNLLRRGYGVERINLNLGDRLFWTLPGAMDYRGGFDNWRSYISRVMDERDITDLVLFGDARPYHRVAIATAQLRGVRVHVLEEGYFRPDWITLEAGGCNGFSSLPRDPDVIRALARELPDPPAARPITGDMRTRAFWDIAYNGANVFFPYLYPRYRRYRPQHAFVEYAGWIGRFLRKKTEARRAASAVATISQPGTQYFLLPLQLDSDYQIRVHSPFSSMTEVIDLVARSFAAHAPKDARLVVKLHPLDNGLVNRRRAVTALANKLGIGDRLLFIDGGRPEAMIAGAAGVVVVNSTIGTLAIREGKPTVALGLAIYDMAGLTHQGSLESFWTEPTPPDPELERAFRKVVAHRTQINGGFYSREAVVIAVSNVVERLMTIAPLPQSRPVVLGWTKDDAFEGAGSPVPGE